MSSSPLKEFNIYSYKDLQKLYGMSLTYLTRPVLSDILAKNVYFMIGNDYFYDQRTFPEKHIKMGIIECINGGTFQLRNLHHDPGEDKNVYELTFDRGNYHHLGDFVWVFVD